MLDDEEFSRVWAVKAAQRRFLDGREAALAEYERITGFKETNFNALFHHRISQHGPPCPRCGKVLRTQIAYKCFECGLVLHEPNWAFLFQVTSDPITLKAGGTVVFTDFKSIEGRVHIGDTIQFRDGNRVVLTTAVHGVEEALGSPPEKRVIGLLLPSDVSGDLIRPEQEVWLVGSSSLTETERQGHG